MESQFFNDKSFQRATIQRAIDKGCPVSMPTFTFTNFWADQFARSCAWLGIEEQC